MSGEDQVLQGSNDMDGRMRNVELDVREIKTILLQLVDRLERADEQRRSTCPYRDDINGCLSVASRIDDLAREIKELCERLESIENLKVVRETQVGMANKLIDVGFKMGLGAFLIKGAELIITWVQTGQSK